MKSKENWVGAWAYTIGVILAIIIGVIVGFSINVPNFNKLSIYASITLAILGIVIGLLNVNNKDVTTFLLAGVVLVIVSRFGLETVTQGTLIVGILGSSIFNALLLLFVPATIIVALKTLFSISRV